MVPEQWLNTPIIHLGPVAREVDPTLARAFPNAFVGLTPQGWLRTWDEQGLVSFAEWPEASFVLQYAGAAVISIEDVRGNEDIIEEMASSVRVLAVTEGAHGARLYWNGDLRRFRPPQMDEIDPTGAGDIFATAFFYRLNATRDPWEAARFATNLASYSVMRYGLNGVPLPDEVQAVMTEVL
jgi:sugar/nucleoside kinase (ribokinase family)